MTAQLGPVTAPSKTRYEEQPKNTKSPSRKVEAVVRAEPEADDEELSELDSDEREEFEDENELSELDSHEGEQLDDDDEKVDSGSDSDSPLLTFEEVSITSSNLLDGRSDGEFEGSDIEQAEAAADALTESSSRKRKRGVGEDLEGAYLQKLAKEEAKDEKKRLAIRHETQIDEREVGAEKEDEGEEDVSDADSDALPAKIVHESLMPTKDESELEKSTRTVFISNVSTKAITSKSAKKTLLTHLSSFCSSLGEKGGPHKIESIRFRSTAYSTAAKPKKAAFVLKELHDATTKSTNAYAVYSTPLAAREAVKKLNATKVLDRHIRVDGVAHPQPVDHKRCIFVGNLGFVDDESAMIAADGEKRRAKAPSDIEEGLWREFGKLGRVESVRVVRDPITRVGKGFAYVQFQVNRASFNRFWYLNH
jgi:nucleolar protein 12